MIPRVSCNTTKREFLMNAVRTEMSCSVYAPRVIAVDTPRYSGPPLTMHSHPCALHQSRYTLRTFGRIRVTGNLRNPCFCAASKRIRSFCVSRWPMLRLPIFARVGMPRLSRSTSSLSGRVIVEIITSCAAPLKKITDKLGFKNSIIKPST